MRFRKAEISMAGFFYYIDNDMRDIGNLSMLSREGTASGRTISSRDDPGRGGRLWRSAPRILRCFVAAAREELFVWRAAGKRRIDRALRGG
jgi:hypothetical protein